MRSLLLVPVVALVIAGCGSGGSSSTHTANVTPSRSPQTLQAWAGQAAPRLTNIGDDAKQIKAAGDAKDYASMAGACVSLKTDVAALRSIGKPPVVEAVQPFNDALTSYTQAATECAEGAQTPPDEALLSSMVDDMGSGSASLDQADRAITAFGS